MSLSPAQADFLERFYKEVLRGPNGNLHKRVEWLESMVKKLGGQDITNYVTQVLVENKEIILPSIYGGETDPTSPDFSGVVISPSGQEIGGMLYSFAIVFEGEVFLGLGDDGGTPVVSGITMDANGNVYFVGAVPALTLDANVFIGPGSGTAVDGSVVAENIAIGKSTLAIGDGVRNVVIGSYALTQGGDSTGENVAIGFRALNNNDGHRNVALGPGAGHDSTGSDHLYIDNRERTVVEDEALIYGTFDDDPANQELHFNANVDVNGDFTVNGSPIVGLSDGDKGDITVGSSGTTMTIDDDAVTNAKLANMAQDTIKGRASGAGTGDPTDLTATQATAILNNMVGDSGAGGTKGLAPAPAAGDAAAGKYLKADGTWSVPPSTSGGVSDGDKGDITVSGSGATWTIDNGAVTLAKIVDATGQYKIMARSSSGSGDWEEVSSSSNVFSILQAADYAAVKALLDLEIGTDVQAYNANLAAIAGLTSAADKLPYFTGSGTAALTDLSSFARGVINQGTATLMRAALGLSIGVNVQAWDSDLDLWAGKYVPSGDPLGTTDTQTVTNKRITPRVGTTASSATPTINTDNYDWYIITALAVNITSMTTNLSGTPTNGQRLYISITGTATRTIAWGASFENGGATLPTTTSGTNRLDIELVWNAATSKWRCVNHSLVAGTDVQPYDAELAAIAGLTSAANSFPYFTGSGTAALLTIVSAIRTLLASADVATFRTNAGLGTGDSPQFTAVNIGHASDTTLTRVSAGVAAIEGKNIALNGTSEVHTVGTIELGAASDTTLARSSAGNMSIEGNLVYRAGGTDVPITDGGTGASDAATARTNLGLAIGTNVQAYDADLGAIAALSPSNDDIIQRKAGAWVNRTIAQLITDLTSGLAALFAPVHAPSFEAYQASGSPTTVATATTTAVICGSENNDSGGYYNTTTGKFTPLVAGTYMIYGYAYIVNLGDGKQVWAGLRKNGTTERWFFAGGSASATNEVGGGGSQMFYLDGVDDYVELIIYHEHGSNRDTANTSSNLTHWGGYRISSSDICGV